MIPPELQKPGLARIAVCECIWGATIKDNLYPLNTLCLGGPQASQLLANVGHKPRHLLSLCANSPTPTDLQI